MGSELSDPTTKLNLTKGIEMAAWIHSDEILMWAFWTALSLGGVALVVWFVALGARNHHRRQE